MIYAIYFFASVESFDLFFQVMPELWVFCYIIIAFYTMIDNGIKIIPHRRYLHSFLTIFIKNRISDKTVFYTVNS